MTEQPIDIALRDLRCTWEKRRAAAQRILRLIDTRGMSRPARDPDEREWLNERGSIPFREDDEMGAAARIYYSRKYNR